MTKIKGKKIRLAIMLFMACLIILLSFVGPTLAPNDPLETNFTQVLKSPSKDYPLGTDQVGRCILSRILHGAKVSLGLTFLLLGLISTLGLIIGVIAGMGGKKIDTIIMRIADTMLAFPDIVFAIAVVGVLGPGIINMIIALALIWWTKYARLSRTLVMGIKNSEYVLAGTMAGAGRMKIVTHYIFPNIVSPFIIQFVLDIGGMMLTIASLSFLGLGIQPPTPEWGNMLSEGKSYMQTAPWLLIYPGLAIFMVVMIFNLLGDVLRDILDPKQI